VAAWDVNPIARRSAHLLLALACEKPLGTSKNSTGAPCANQIHVSRHR
jgi:hypothetical protein